MAKQILFNKEARTSLKKGIDKLADAVRMTLGPRGRAAVIEKGYGAPQVTFDGVTVAKEIELEDKFENLGADFLKQTADRTNDNVGDGTTTSVVLAHALIDAGEKAISEEGFNVIKLSEEIKKGSEEVVKFLESQKELINDNKKIEEVAILSSKDKKIGALIAEVMSKVKKEGVVTIEDSNTIGSSYDLVEGMQFDRGYVSPYMITNQERMETILENPNILVTDKKISTVNDLLPLLEKLVKAGKKELVIIAEELEGEALATLVLNKLRGIFTVLAVKAPGFGDRKKEMLEDIAILTGASIVSEELGKKIENVEISDLGQAHRVVSNKDNTTIIGGKGDKKIIDDRIAQVKTQVKKADSEFDIEKLKERLGKLSGGVAVIKVGAPTESAQKELKQRVEDAVNATRAAMEEGIVPGGGIALFNANLALAKIPKKFEGAVDKEAWAILSKAMRAPIEAIITNSGESVSKIISNLESQKVKDGNDWIGFNAVLNNIGDLKEVGIIDPLKVTKTAFINAISVASNYLTIGVALTEKPEPKGGGSSAPGMPPGMGY
ncbi:chaperonin GroEL [Patescibacteria group bacterium]|nr:chaperonin GroEL [Patescibacteria group bacterium]